MKYEYAPDLKERMNDIINTLKIPHLIGNIDKIECLRSRGSSTRRTLARCHTLGKVMQMGMKAPAHYTIEFLEPFEKLNKKEQDKVIIHELMHIPQTFGGGFRHHDFVCDKSVDLMYERFESLKNPEKKPRLPSWWS